THILSFVSSCLLLSFSFHDTATTEIYTLSLHDALPISPQDGRIRVRLEERELDLRVSTVPTLYGESVVLRLLDRDGRPVALEELGMEPETVDRFRRLAERPHGTVLATGHTGSGKTTTLYAALGLRPRSAEKIITVEDPV